MVLIKFNSVCSLQGYQFWTRTDETGHFTISAIRPDTYNLYAWVPGIIGDYKHDDGIVIRQGLFLNPLITFTILPC